MTDKPMHSKAIEAAIKAVENAAHDSFSFAEAVNVAIPAYLAAMEAEGPTAEQVTAGAKVLRDAGFSGDCYHTARLMHSKMLSARPNVKG